MEKKRILVVDDEEVIREILVDTIIFLHPQEDIIVVHAEHGAHALDILNKSERPFNLLISDVRMPVMDGVALVKQVREVYPQMHVVLTSATGEPDGHEAHDFVPKSHGSMKIVAKGLRRLFPAQS